VLAEIGVGVVVNERAAIFGTMRGWKRACSSLRACDAANES
jgi:hypothetical protein